MRFQHVKIKVYPVIAIAAVALVVLVICACSCEDNGSKPKEHNQPPTKPVNASPANGATNQPLDLQLDWNDSTDPDGDPVSYDIYFSSSPNPTTKVDSNLTSSSYHIGPLDTSTTYYWKVIAKDDHGHSTAGDVWSFTTISDGGVVYGTPTILRMIPHSTTAFTQGLLYADSLLYESTGKQQGRSRIYKIDPSDGQILEMVTAPGWLTFAEGLALKDNRLVQLTYVQQIAFVYTYPDIDLIDTLTYHGQGWGLTADATRYFMSNGSDTLYFRDDSFNIIRKVNVTLEGTPVYHLNELEYVNGKVWANVWYNNSIFEIDIQTGQVTKVIDCTELDTLSQPHGGEDVLNGIAYNNDTGTYFLTGKYWRYIFEVTIP